MGMNYYFGEIENQIRDACNEYPPDFEKIERLMEQCEDLSIVSREDSKDNMLSNIILWYPEIGELRVHCENCTDKSCDGCPLNYPDYDGRYLPQIVKLFLKHGFDVTRDNGLVGRMCLGNLTFSSRDTYVIEAEKLLLNAGADPMIYLDGETVVQAYAGEDSFRYLEGEYRISHLYSTMAEIAEAASQNREYQDIEFFEACIGKRISKIEMACTGVTPSRSIYNVGFPFPKYKNCFATPIIFHCEGKQLCVTRYMDIRIDPTVRERAETVCDIEQYFPDCVGHRITAIDFDIHMLKKNKKRLNRVVILIRLDNGRVICISRNWGEMPREESTAFFSVV